MKSKIAWIIASLTMAISSGICGLFFFVLLLQRIDWYIGYSGIFYIYPIAQMGICTLAMIIGLTCSVVGAGSAVIKKGKPSAFLATSFLMASVPGFMLGENQYEYNAVAGFILVIGIILLVVSLLLMATMCFAGKGDSKLLKLRFIPSVLYIIPWLGLVLTFGIGLMGTMIDYGFDDAIESIIEGWFPMLAVIAYAGSLFVSMIASAMALSNKPERIKEAKADKPIVPKAKVVTRAQVSPVKNSVPEELRKYKQLYDDGVITEEEFAQKKKQLMGL